MKVKKKFLNYLLNLLESRLVKMILKRLLISGGIKTWLIKFLASEVFEEIVEPLVAELEEQGHLFYDRTKGKIRAKKIRDARQSGNEQDYNSSIDDVFN